jgi:hypothetical protein
LRTEEEHVPHVCRIGIHRKNDFDEIIFIVQVSIRNYEIMDVLLDGGNGVNITSEHLWRELGLKMPMSTPFMVRIVDQRNVQPVRLIRNFKIKLARCTFKISITILYMEDIPEPYFML